MNSLCVAQADPLEGVQIDQNVSQGIVIGDGKAIAEFGALDPKMNRLAVDAFGGSALFVDRFVFFTLAIQLIAQASTRAGCQSGDAAALRPLGMLDRAGFTRTDWMEQRTDKPATLMGNERRLAPEGIP